MTIQHKSIPDVDLHEIKGAAGSLIGKVPIATGAGTAPFGYVNPIGSISFINYAAPYSIVYPSAYTKISPVTTATGVAVEASEGVNARITYTGALTSKFRLTCNIAVSQTSGANRDVGIALYKTGGVLAGSEIFQTTTSGVIHLTTTIFDTILATNDYIECFIQNKGGSGDVLIHSFMLNFLGLRG